MARPIASPEPYAITTDHLCGLVRIELSGFWDDTVAAGPERHFAAAVRSLGLPPNQHRQLCISREFEVQSSDTLTELHPLIAEKAIRAKRLAMVEFGALAKLPGARLTTGFTTASFATEEEALEWLIAKEAQ